MVDERDPNPPAEPHPEPPAAAGSEAQAPPPPPGAAATATGPATAVPLTQQQERTWAMAAHLSSLIGYFIPLGNIIGPLIIWLTQKDKSTFVDDQGKESLNFQISITIYVIIAGILSIILIGIPLLVALILADLILVIIAAIKANDGVAYRYPLTLRLIT